MAIMVSAMGKETYETLAAITALRPPALSRRTLKVMPIDVTEALSETTRSTKAAAKKVFASQTVRPVGCELQFMPPLEVE